MADWFDAPLSKFVAALEEKASEAEQAAADAFDAHGGCEDVDLHESERYKWEDIISEIRWAAEAMRDKE